MSDHPETSLVYTTPPPPPYLPPRMTYTIELLEYDSSDDEDTINTVVDLQSSPVTEGILNVYVDIAISTEKFVDDQVRKKSTIPLQFIEQLTTQIDSVIIIYHSLPVDHGLKVDFGVVLRDLEHQKNRIEQYMHKPERKTSDREAKIEAYQDPEIACYAELSKDGLKTRNRFYKR